MSKTIQVVLSDDEHAELKLASEKEGRKMSNMARRYIKDGLSGTKTLVTQINGSDLLINIDNQRRRG